MMADEKTYFKLENINKYQNYSENNYLLNNYKTISVNMSFERKWHKIFELDKMVKFYYILYKENFHILWNEWMAWTEFEIDAHLNLPLINLSKR